MRILIIIVITICLCSCAGREEDNKMVVRSPAKNIIVNVELNDNGEPFYMVFDSKRVIIDTSYLGFSFKDMPELKGNLEVISVAENHFNETWSMPWGEQSEVVNYYNELRIELEELTELKRQFNVVFKVYNDGVGFRYEFPEQANWSEALITEENTQFNLTKNYKTFWIPGDWEIYEHTYKTTLLSEIDAIQFRDHPNLAQTYIPENAVNTPVTLVGDNGIHLSFHEAALVDYSDMTLKVDTANLSFQSHLVGSDNYDHKVKRSLPFETPWRTIQIAEKAPDLIASNLIVNLNEPNKLGDVSWFKPKKYTGVWWEMHLGKTTWDMASGRHGATTSNVKKYIDFSARNNIGGVLVEGWNTGWSQDEGGFDFITPYPDYDLEEVISYADEKGVEMIMHHETFGDVERYIRQQDTAYALMNSLGIRSVKSGYVFKLKPEGEYHHGQFMVNHYNNSVIEAAKYNIAVNAHEPIKATGLRRTYPNVISREGLRGQEFNAWAEDGGNPPEHLPIVAFTRMLAGPIDYTPGIFNIKFDEYKSDNQVNTTLAQQLALYVVIYSPIQMAADLVEHYEANPEPLKFIKDVGVDWEKSLVLNGEVGDYVTIARKERQTGNWFLGSITDENSRSLEVDFSFLDAGQEYEATIYKDGENAHWNDNPLDIEIETQIINNSSKIKLDLAEGGGVAISVIKTKGS
ncbi:MAG: glycoside hydrolase family 97 protein [Psychroserpens sp.]|nr:glycoside hydrolase family 97 protein [Psychroserpens sp.]